MRIGHASVVVVIDMLRFGEETDVWLVPASGFVDFCFGDFECFAEYGKLFVVAVGILDDLYGCREFFTCIGGCLQGEFLFRGESHREGEGGFCQ